MSLRCFRNDEHKERYFLVIQKYHNEQKKNRSHCCMARKLVQRVVCYKCKIYKRILRKWLAIQAEEKKQFFIRDFLFRKKKRRIPLVLRCIEIDGRRKSIRKNTKKMFRIYKVQYERQGSLNLKGKINVSFFLHRPIYIP